MNSIPLFLFSKDIPKESFGLLTSVADMIEDIERQKRVNPLVVHQDFFWVWLWSIFKLFRRVFFTLYVGDL